MKKIFAVLMVFVLLSHSLLNVGIAIYYHLNKAYIAKELCENRDNPKLHCNGHCYLAKQLKKTEENEQKQTQNIIREREEIISMTNEELLYKYVPQSVTTLFCIANSSLYCSGNFNSLLKPPVA